MDRIYGNREPIVRSVLRIIDANLNRAREAARVVEEHCRFLRDDAATAAQLKSIRHALGQLESAIGTAHLVAARDTAHDIGTGIEGAAEYHRASPESVLTANLRRLQEALRVLEEYSKGGGTAMPAIPGESIRQLEQARYAAYQAERRIMAASATSRRGRLARQRLMLVLTSSLCTPCPPEDVIGAALTAGVRCFQLREKDGSDRERMARIGALAGIIRDAAGESAGDAPLVIVNDRVDFALALNADGVHLGQDDLGIPEARRIAGPDLLIGKSARNQAELNGALLAGADYLGAGSMFQTATKQKVILNGPVWGAEASALAGDLPVFCIGGITPANLAGLMSAFPAGYQPRIAVSGAVCQSPEPASVCLKFLSALGT